MKKIKKIVFASFLFLFFATLCNADTISLKSGDVLKCTVSSKYLGLRTPYQTLFFLKAYISAIENTRDPSRPYRLNTINKDSFSGVLINSQIVVLMADGRKNNFSPASIERIQFEASDSTVDKGLNSNVMKKTTTFDMKNGDSFSGQMMQKSFKIHMDKSTLTIEGSHLFQIIFTDPDTRMVEMHLLDGSIHTGMLSETLINIHPDSFSPLDIRTSQFQSIQFHAFKHINKTISSAEYDDKGLCIFKCDNGFISECCKFETTAVLVPDPEGHVGKIDVQTEGGAQTLSEAGQAIVVSDRKAPPPAPVFFDAQKIQAVFGDALAAAPIAPEKFMLFFEINSTRLISESKPLIFEIIKSADKREAYDIHITGYADRKGAYKYNLALSQKRAAYIQRLLIKSGIKSKFIELSYSGEDNPQVQTADNVEESRNRRVEVIVR